MGKSFLNFESYQSYSKHNNEYKRQSEKKLSCNQKRKENYFLNAKPLWWTILPETASTNWPLIRSWVCSTETGGFIGSSKAAAVLNLQIPPPGTEFFPEETANYINRTNFYPDTERTQIYKLNMKLDYSSQSPNRNTWLNLLGEKSIAK